MLRNDYQKIKREEGDDEQDQYGAAGAWRAAEHKERVREMTVKTAVEAGFGCSDHSGDGCERAAAARITNAKLAPPSMKTPRYDGKADWEAFHAQFELLARVGKWSTEVNALQLAMCLTGDAVSSLLLLSPDDRSD